MLLFKLESLCIWTILAEYQVSVKLSSVSWTSKRFSCTHLFDSDFFFLSVPAEGICFFALCLASVLMPVPQSVCFSVV